MVELRVHGVGGPQGPRMLGFQREEDVETLAPFRGVDGEMVPRDANTRFVRPLGDYRVEAYEWGALTAGSPLRSLWVVYLPFTLLNVGGWGRPDVEHRGRPRQRDLVARVLAYLGTVAYVWWFAYLLLELAAKQWRTRLVSGAYGDPAGTLGRWAVPTVAVLLFVGLLVALVLVNRRSAERYERYTPDRIDQGPERWSDDETAVHPDFFAHAHSLDGLYRRHLGVLVVAAAAALAIAALGVGRPRTGLGLAIVALATVQVVLLVLLWCWDFYRGIERLQRAALLTVGTVLCHAAFSGTALWLRERLATVPGGVTAPQPLPVGAELGLTDQFALGLAAALVVIVLGAVLPSRRHAPTAAGPVVRAARRMPSLGVLVALAFLVAMVAFGVREVTSDRWTCGERGASWWETPRCWYDGYPTGKAEALQDIGARALLALPALIALSLSSRSWAARLLGNVWDVLTFWPRRYHPLAVPPYSERAVPELRARLRHLLGGEGAGVVLSGHSQGSVLSVAALSPLLTDAGTVGDEEGAGDEVPVHLVTYGAPLGTLYDPVFRTALGRPHYHALARQLSRAGRRWRVLWRRTDPIGGPVFGGDVPEPVQEVEIPDPPPGEGWVTPPDAADRPPLERPPRWGVARRHGYYTAEDAYRSFVAEARLDLEAP